MLFITTLPIYFESINKFLSSLKCPIWTTSMIPEYRRQNTFESHVASQKWAQQLKMAPRNQVCVNTFIFSSSVAAATRTWVVCLASAL